MAGVDCIFCKIVTGEIPCSKVYEDDLVIAFLDINPLGEGHTLVLPKEHFGKLDECSDEIASALAVSVKRVSKAVVGAVEADGYNVLCNNGRASGQLVDHVHFHVIPRISGDCILRDWPAGEYEDGRAEIVLEKIRKQL